MKAKPITKVKHEIECQIRQAKFTKFVDGLEQALKEKQDKKRK